MRWGSRARLGIAIGAVLLTGLGASGDPEPKPGNWGRRGPDDERGAANLIPPERVVAAATSSSSPRSRRTSRARSPLRSTRWR